MGQKYPKGQFPNAVIAPAGAGEQAVCFWRLGLLSALAAHQVFL